MSPQQPNTPSDPSLADIVLFLQRNINRLDFGHREFVNDMVGRVFYEPFTEKQRKYLHSLFSRLGGKIT